MTREGEYNGWPNYETWATYTNLTNTEWLWRIAKTLAARDEYGVYLKEWVNNVQYEVIHRQGGLIGNRKEYQQLIEEAGSLWRVDWKQVRDGLLGI